MGQLGTTAPLSAPLRAPIQLCLDTLMYRAAIAELSCGKRHVLARTDEGRLLTWGSNSDLQLGVPNHRAHQCWPTFLDPPHPSRQRRPRGPSQRFALVAAGATHSLAMTPEGTVYQWGLPTHLDHGGHSFVEVECLPADDAVVQLVAGNRVSFARTDSGALYAWGRGDAGQLGHGRFESSTHPVRVGANGPLAVECVTGISCQDAHAMCVTASGALYAWGDNRHGTLGDGLRTARADPCVVMLTEGRVKACVASYTHSMALTDTGDLYLWGTGFFGKESVQTRLWPVQVKPPRGLSVIKIAAGFHFSLALLINGELLAWGVNDVGQLGVASLAKKCPGLARVHAPRISTLVRPVHMAAGAAFYFVWRD